MRRINVTLKPGEASVRCYQCERKSPGSWVFVCYKEREVKKGTGSRGGRDGEHELYQYEWDEWYVTCPECRNRIILRKSEERLPSPRRRR